MARPPRLTPAASAALALDDTALDGLVDAIPALHAWYHRQRRDLPWRRVRDPYAVWVSEVMLQQTRVATVISYWERWLAEFPDVAALAAAPEDRVLKLWEGLGYYSRARNLHAAAKAVVEQHGGVVPNTWDAFRALPGVGDYTAAAVLSICFDHDHAAVDGNVRRVLARLVALEVPLRGAPGGPATEWLATHLLPSGTAAVHNQAVMELGALVCLPRTPRCVSDPTGSDARGACPLKSVCRGFATGCPGDYPRKPPKRAVPHVHVAIGVVMDRQGEGQLERGPRFFIDQRPYDGMLAGLWEFPGGKLEPGETPEEALHRELDEEFAMRVQVRETLPTVDHAYTHLKVTLHPFVCDLVTMDAAAGEGRPYRWVERHELSEVAMPKANHKILALL